MALSIDTVVPLQDSDVRFTASNSVPEPAALFPVLLVPKLNFARHWILSALGPLPPVIQHARFTEAILDAPRSQVTKLFNERLPSLAGSSDW